MTSEYDNQSETATILGSQEWSLNTGLTVFQMRRKQLNFLKKKMWAFQKVLFFHFWNHFSLKNNMWHYFGTSPPPPCDIFYFWITDFLGLICYQY